MSFSRNLATLEGKVFGLTQLRPSAFTPCCPTSARRNKRTPRGSLLDDNERRGRRKGRDATNNYGSRKSHRGLVSRMSASFFARLMSFTSFSQSMAWFTSEKRW